jgi:uncharacterized membrane protein YbaN (DUF454 family)
VAEPDSWHVVRSSFGRVRVHLDHWSDEAAEEFLTQLRAVPGVNGAAATAVTQNVLVLFDAHQVSLEELLAEVGGAWRPGPKRSVASRPSLTLFPRPIDHAALSEIDPETLPDKPFYVTGFRRVLYTIFGWTSVGMAVVGAILPGIPTAPFVILAGYFFIRSSPTAHQWLRNSRWFGPILRDWEEHHGIRRSVRNFAVGLVVFSMIFITLLGLPLTLTLTIVATQIIGLALILRLHVVDHPSPAPALVAP